MGTKTEQRVRRIIGHLDMDAFFAAIEERNNPQWQGQPIVVGADPKEGRGRGVVSTANYAARAYGIHSAMPISTAWRLSETARRKGQPPAIFVSGSWRAYSDTSDRIMALIRAMVPTVQQRSIDEAYMDLSFMGSYAAAERLCRQLKGGIFRKEKLTASVGIGPNKLIAKIASDFKKPDGLTVVTPEKVESFLEPLSIRVIPGVGPKTQALLARHGIRTVADVKKFSRAKLGNMLGKWGLELYEKVRGRDDSPLAERQIAKSIGEQRTFEVDTADAQRIVPELTHLGRDVFRRFHQDGFRSFRTVVVTVRFADFQTTSASHTVWEPMKRLVDLHRESLKLLLPYLDKRKNPAGKLVRLIGVRIEKLT